MTTISRAEYANLYGPTTGDRLRLGDTSLTVEVEHDHAVYGDECVTGGGKTVRDGMALDASAGDEEALDLLLENALVIDPVLGIVKGDVGVKDGRIVAIGKAGNPAVMDGVDPRLRIGTSTIVDVCAGMIVTPGGIDVHVHFVGADQCEHALSSGVTTMIGGGMGPAFAVDCGGSRDIGLMLRAAAAWPMNFGFLARAASHQPHAVAELIAAGVIGVKIHEDFGATPAVIDAALRVADELDFQVQLHTDTLNESGFYEQTMAAIAGRTIHMYHTEGAGGGHAPDIIRCNGEPHCLPSSTNPTNPYTVNTFDEHLDMTMGAHALRADIPEDVAFAESRIRPQSIAAEDVLHDLGAISMMGSDSQGMGRVNEVITRTWQLASKMRDERGRLPSERSAAADNERVRRYLAKYTINAARTFGIQDQVGSLEAGRLADIVVWKPSHFGAKPSHVYKSGFIAWAAMGDGAASLPYCQPLRAKPQWGAFGQAAARLGACFVHPSSLQRDLAGRLDLDVRLLPYCGTRGLTKRDMLWNDAQPHIRVDTQTFEVFVDGELPPSAPATRLPLTASYFAR